VIGRLRGGLSTKIHAAVDAFGNPTDFHLSGGEARDLVGADHLLAGIDADTVIADKAFDFDAQERVIDPLLAASKTVVIPPKPIASSGMAGLSPSRWPRSWCRVGCLRRSCPPSLSFVRCRPRDAERACDA
jgi:hypothetical protein